MIRLRFWFNAGSRGFREGRDITYSDLLFRGMPDCPAAVAWRAGWLQAQGKKGAAR